MLETRGPLSRTKVADAVGIGHERVNYVVDRMVYRGLVSLVADERGVFRVCTHADAEKLRERVKAAAAKKPPPEPEIIDDTPDDADTWPIVRSWIKADSAPVVKTGPASVWELAHA